MRLLAKRTSQFANLHIGFKPVCIHHVSYSFQQYSTEIQQLKPSATMGEQLLQEQPDLTTWSADQLIARVTFLEQQLKEQTVKCVCPGAQLETALIA